MISSSQIIIIRQLWHYYLENNDALIWVVDSCDRERFVEVKEELHDLMQDDRLRNSTLLVLANKQASVQILFTDLNLGFTQKEYICNLMFSGTE